MYKSEGVRGILDTLYFTPNLRPLDPFLNPIDYIQLLDYGSDCNRTVSFQESPCIFWLSPQHPPRLHKKVFGFLLQQDFSSKC